MKQLEEKLNLIEKEISELKWMVMQQQLPKKKISLKGSLKGLKIEEEKIEKAKKTLFKGA
ncbi:MAG: hypothetical protein HYY37_06535 [Candidatus Aenigmarchaeota archaeon]|nr:hypothetical protein [Candidatus Aenigmarchaeota archaeon]